MTIQRTVLGGLNFPSTFHGVLSPARAVTSVLPSPTLVALSLVKTTVIEKSTSLSVVFSTTPEASAPVSVTLHSFLMTDLRLAMSFFGPVVTLPVVTLPVPVPVEVFAGEVADVPDGVDEPVGVAEPSPLGGA